MLIALVALQVAVTGLPIDIAEGCTDKDGTLSLASCYSERAEAWERRMKAAYPKAIAYTVGRQRDALVRSQTAWLKYRDTACEFYELQTGSIHYIQGAYCMLDLTRRRALELEQFPLP